MRVVDGDTIRVLVDGGASACATSAIDTPESVKPGTPVRVLRREASARRTSGSSTGGACALETDVERARPLRAPARVRVPRRRLFVNAELVRGGYARPLTFPPNVRHAERFARSRARRARRAGAVERLRRSRLHCRRWRDAHATEPRPVRAGASSRSRRPTRDAPRARCAARPPAALAHAAPSSATHKHGSMRFVALVLVADRDRRPRDGRDVPDALHRDGLSRGASGQRARASPGGSSLSTSRAALAPSRRRRHDLPRSCWISR